MQDEFIPDEDSIFYWIEEIFSQGIRRPGYQADRWTEEYCAMQFREFGLENVRLEPVSFFYWEPLLWSLHVLTESEELAIPCFPLPHSASTEEVELQLVAYNENSKKDIKGFAVLEDMKMMQQMPTAPVTKASPLSPADVLLGLMKKYPDETAAIMKRLMQQHPSSNKPAITHGQSVLKEADRIIDPFGTFEGRTQVLPFVERFFWVMEPAMFSGAAAWIGVLSDYPGDRYEYYIPYDTEERRIPGVWIRGSDGARIHKMLAAGPVKVRLQVDAIREESTSYNVVGELPGADDDWIIIGSHHDGPWASAVEDGSGIALVLAQAAYWSKVPVSDRPHWLVFLLNTGHMAASAGLNTSIKEHAKELKRIVLEVHLEHAACEFVERDGNLVPTGEPETRWFYTSQTPRLERTVAEALIDEGLYRSLILPPDVFARNPLTDAGSFFALGVPIVNFETAPFYLFDPVDTLDKIDRAGLVPLSRATIRIIESTLGISAGKMRSGSS